MTSSSAYEYFLNPWHSRDIDRLLESIQNQYDLVSLVLPVSLPVSAMHNNLSEKLVQCHRAIQYSRGYDLLQLMFGSVDTFLGSSLFCVIRSGGVWHVVLWHSARLPCRGIVITLKYVANI